MTRRSILTVLLGALAISIPAAAAAPDFSRIVVVEPEVSEAGQVSGLVRNIGERTIRNVVLRVRHRWRWDGGNYRHNDNATVARLVLPGDAAGFAAVHIPPAHVPDTARYSMDVTVLELTEIFLAPEQAQARGEQ